MSKDRQKKVRKMSVKIQDFLSAPVGSWIRTTIVVEKYMADCIPEHLEKQEKTRE
jgi:hypothetical protein